MSPAPIALFVYARPEHTRRTVDALSKNVLAEQSTLFIFSDAPRSSADNAAVEEVRDYIRTVSGFRSVNIVERGKNLGLAASIIDGVTSIVTAHGAVIVVEDDLVTSPYFLQYMNDGLRMYENDDDVISIHGYLYPVRTPLPDSFFICGADCWGWGTWKRGWEQFEPDGTVLLRSLTSKGLHNAFDWDGHYGNMRMLKRQIAGTVDSWAIRWHASAFLKRKLTLYPGVSLVRNIGGDELGTHTKSLTEFQVPLADRPLTLVRLPRQESTEGRKAFVDFFAGIQQSVFRKIIRRITTFWS